MYVKQNKNDNEFNVIFINVCSKNACVYTV